MRADVNINLALILTVLTLLSGMVVAMDRFIWRSMDKESGASYGRRVLVEYSRSFFPILLFVLIIRSFVFEPFRIPSGSMMPTLLQGDFIFVKKYAYGLRLPVTETKILETGEPERGDVVVFRLPSDPSIDYIKRVVGLPGDEIVYERHRLKINGQIIDLQAGAAATRAEPVFIEQLGGREHEIFVTKPENTYKDGVFHVPEGHYFVMGDNRDNSRDSRFIGFVPEANLVGEAVRIWMHIDGLSWPRWERIGAKIQ
jgi:signal peptidase I